MKIIDSNDPTKDCFNITKYLLSCYQNGTTPDPTFMKMVDFSEISFLQIHYYSSKDQQSINYTVNETIAQNCMNNLPFEAYKQFMTAEWIEFTKEQDNSIIKSVIFKKNLPLLEHFYTLGLEKAKTNNEYASVFFRKFYETIFNLSNNLDRINQYSKLYNFNEEFVVGFHKLLKKSFCEIKFFQSLNFIGKKQEKIKYIKNPKWLDFSINRSRHYQMKELAFNDLFKILVQQESFYPIFEDALQQLLKKYNQTEIKQILGIENFAKQDNHNKPENVLHTVVANYNIKAIQLLINTLGISPEQIIQSLENTIENNIKSISQYKNNDFSDLSFLLNNNYLNLKEQFFLKLDSKYFPLYLFGNNEECKEHLLNNKEQYLNETILNNCSAFEIIALAKILQEFKKSEDKLGYVLDLNLNDLRYDSKICFIIAENITNHNEELLNLVSLEQLPENSWEKLSEFMKDLNVSGKKSIHEKNKKEIFNDNETNIFLQQFKLNIQLKNKESSNKNKLKV